MTPALVAAVLVAGALGAVLRWMVSRWLSRSEGPYRNLPTSVLLVNVAGSALAGAILGLAEAGAVNADLRLILLTGFCGGLTTFSTLSVETIQLVLDGRWRPAVLSVGANLVLGIGAAALAYLLTR